MEKMKRYRVISDNDGQMLMKLCDCGCGRPSGIYKQTDRSQGQVTGEPRRFIPGHRPPISFEIRFEKKVDRNGPIPAHCPQLGKCWIWKASKKPSGYGQIQRGRKDEGVLYSHRIVWIRVNGPIPVGKEVCHKCDNRACVRLSHLFLGTRKDNMQDCSKKGRIVNGYGRCHRSDLDRRSIAPR